jgi:hypothetical protein
VRLVAVPGGAPVSPAVLHDRFVCVPGAHVWARLSAVCRCGEVLRGGVLSAWRLALRMTDDDIVAAASGTVRP